MNKELRNNLKVGLFTAVVVAGFLSAYKLAMETQQPVVIKPVNLTPQELRNDNAAKRADWVSKCINDSTLFTTPGNGVGDIRVTCTDSAFKLFPERDWASEAGANLLMRK